MFACLWVFEHIVVSILELHAENLMIVVLKPLSRIILESPQGKREILCHKSDRTGWEGWISTSCTYATRVTYILQCSPVQGNGIVDQPSTRAKIIW